MNPLSSWPPTARHKIAGVFTDIDDTLTTDGAITPDALQALHNLKAQGLMVIPITGRPVGWSIPFASAWPVDAMVAENGAVALLHNKPTNQVNKIYQQDLPTRTHNFQEMQRIAKRVLTEIPGTVVAQDSPGRETDIAFDHSEFHKLTAAQIQQVVQLLKQEGMMATVSSIHINAWFGSQATELYQHMETAITKAPFLGPLSYTEPSTEFPTNFIPLLCQPANTNPLPTKPLAIQFTT